MLAPSDYYARLHEIEQEHPWHRGMRRVTAALLGERARRGGRLLDAGCGTGGFLRWALDRASFERVCGTDVSAEALALARERVPEGEFLTAPLRALPFGAASFDLVVANDVLQHVPEADVGASLAELRRVTAPTGALLVRTNGARSGHAAGADWRVYDRAGLVRAIEEAGFRCERATYANVVGSLWATTRGRAPRAPDAERHGIPVMPARPAGALVYALLAGEARYLSGGRRSLPYGHTLLVVGVPRT
jgi:SAM-dependent methyltransferase